MMGEKLVALLKLSGYIREMTPHSRGVLYSYGPAGTLLRENIKQSWWKHMVTRRKNSFPVEGDAAELQTVYQEVSKIVGQKLPFSIASLRVEALPSNSSPTDKLLFNSSQYTTMKLASFCDPARSRMEFDQLLSDRFDWWKLFSGNPGKFSLADLGTEDGLLGRSIQYEFPWGREVVETVQNKGDDLLKAVDGIDVSDKYPHQIDCQAKVEVAMATFLEDAFTEKKMFKGTKKRQVLELHGGLAPFKVALAVSGVNKKELGEVADYIAREMRSSDVSILSADDKAGETTFTKNDGMGIPFTVIVSDHTLETGVVGLRNRDTTLEEQLAVSKLVSTVQRHLS